MTPEEKADQIRIELARQLEQPTLEAFNFIQKTFVKVEDEAQADQVLSSQELETLLSKNKMEVYIPRLGELMEEAGFVRKMVIRKNTMMMAWLLKKV